MTKRDISKEKGTIVNEQARATERKHLLDMKESFGKLFGNADALLNTLQDTLKGNIPPELKKQLTTNFENIDKIKKQINEKVDKEISQREDK